jgi:hypothetical protein
MAPTSHSCYRNSREEKLAQSLKESKSITNLHPWRPGTESQYPGQTRSRGTGYSARWRLRSRGHPQHRSLPWGKEASESGRDGADLEVLFSWSAVPASALDLALSVGEHGPPPVFLLAAAPSPWPDQSPVSLGSGDERRGYMGYGLPRSLIWAFIFAYMG